MCTSFSLREKDGSYVYGRTVEFGRDLEENLLLLPRKFSYQGIGPDGTQGSGLNWQGKYAAIGINVFGLKILMDGINEKGLSGGMLHLPNSAAYQNPTPAEAKNSIAAFQILNYALSNFASVDEAKTGFSSIFVNNAPLEEWHGVPKLHMTLHDTQGKSIVIEYLKGELVITDNPVGVMTNDPPMPWHLANLGNYINLSPVEKDPISIDGVTITAPSSGSGLHGMPGDFFSPSRFVRAFIYSVAAQEYAPNVPKVELAWKFLNNFDIPPGAVMIQPGGAYAGGVGGWESTQVSCVADAKNLVYYVRNFNSLNIKKFDLMAHDLDASEAKSFAMSNVTTYEIIA